MTGHYSDQVKVSLAATIMFMIVLAATWSGSPYYVSDNEQYINLAEGLPSHKPFSGRLLLPELAHTIDAVFQTSIDSSFYLVALSSLFILILSITKVVSETTGSFVLVIPTVLSPYLLKLTGFYYLPDILFSALLALFLISMYKEWIFPSLLSIFALTLCRESAFLVGLVAIAILIRRKWLALASAILLCMLLGALIVSMYSEAQGSNIHNVGGLTYFVGKVVFNFTRNVIGLRFTTSTLNECLSPLFKLQVPSWLNIGSINWVGFCGVYAEFPLQTALSALSLFGIIPTMVGYLMIKRFTSIVTNGQIWLLIALFYGLVSFAIGPALGSRVAMLMGYAWPVFWLAAPTLISDHCHFDQKSICMLLSLHIACCWLPGISWLLDLKSSLPTDSIMVVFLIIAHLCAYRIIRAYVKAG